MEEKPMIDDADNLHRIFPTEWFRNNFHGTPSVVELRVLVSIDIVDWKPVCLSFLGALWCEEDSFSIVVNPVKYSKPTKHTLVSTQSSSSILPVFVHCKLQLSVYIFFLLADREY